ncbi:MAG: hypothetical protein AB4063_03430 [Crocosphaera sp.]
MKPRQSLFNPMGFDYPYDDIELPEWAKPLLTTWEDYVLAPGNQIKADFDDFECGLFENAYAYIQEGMKLGVMRYKRLYEEKRIYSFKDYCEKLYMKSYNRCLETILAAQIGWELLWSGFQEVPSNVSQAIALTKTFFKDGFDQPDIVRSWEWVLEYSKATGKKITAGLINFLVNPDRKEEKVKIKVGKKNWEKFKAKARESNIDPESAVEGFIKSFIGEDSTEEPEGDAPPASNNQNMTNKFKNIESEPWFKEMTEMYQAQATINENYDTSPDS